MQSLDAVTRGYRVDLSEQDGVTSCLKFSEIFSRPRITYMQNGAMTNKEKYAGQRPPWTRPHHYMASLTLRYTTQLPDHTFPLTPHSLGEVGGVSLGGCTE